MSRSSQLAQFGRRPDDFSPTRAAIAVLALVVPVALGCSTRGATGLVGADAEAILDAGATAVDAQVSADALDAPGDDGALRAPPLRMGMPAGFAPDTLYWGADIYQSSRTGLVLEEMMREAELPAFCIESPDGRRAQWMLGAVLPWDVMVDDPEAWGRVKAGLDAARAAGVPMQLALDITRWPRGLSAARSAEARGERLCSGSPCTVPFSPLATDFWEAAARWQAEAARELDGYLGDPVVLLSALGEPSIDVVRWTLPVPDGFTRQSWVSLQLRELEQRMIESLRGAVGPRASVTIRHAPWYLTSPENQLRWGVRPEDFNAVCDETLPGGVMGIDVYEQPDSETLELDLATTQGLCTRSQHIFAAELGVVGTAIAQDDIGRWARRIQRDSLGRPSRLLGASVYCWNCLADPNGPSNTLSAEQRRWMGEGFRSLVTGPARPCAPRCGTHPTWRVGGAMSVAVGGSVEVQASMPVGCSEAEVFVQTCCHTGNCLYAQGLDEDADCPMPVRGIPLSSGGSARVTFDAAHFAPGWVRVHARGAGAPGQPPAIRVQLGRGS